MITLDSYGQFLQVFTAIFGKRAGSRLFSSPRHAHRISFQYLLSVANLLDHCIVKFLVLKIIALLLIIAALFLLIPSGPLWFIWFGEDPGVQNDADPLAILSLLGVVLCLAIVFLRLMASMLWDDTEEPAEGDAAPKSSESAPDDLNVERYVRN